MHFCQIFGLSELLTDEKLALKQGITLSKSLTERESSHQIFLPDMIFLVNVFVQTSHLKFCYVSVSIDCTGRRGEKLTLTLHSWFMV